MRGRDNLSFREESANETTTSPFEFALSGRHAYSRACECWRNYACVHAFVVAFACLLSCAYVYSCVCVGARPYAFESK
eukprot:6189436-Pleurochrysis_carterae.AAC.2